MRCQSFSKLQPQGRSFFRGNRKEELKERLFAVYSRALCVVSSGVIWGGIKRVFVRCLINEQNGNHNVMRDYCAST